MYIWMLIPEAIKAKKDKMGILGNDMRIKKNIGQLAKFLEKCWKE